MKKLIVISMLAIALGTLLGKVLETDDSYILIAIADKALEARLVSFLMALFFIFVIFYASFRFLGFTLTLGGRAESWKKRGAQKNTVKGLLDLMEGRWKNSQRLLEKSATNSETALINYLAAARAAHEQNDDAKRDEFLHLAHKSTPKADVAVGMTQAQLQFSRGQYEQCLATLVRLRKKVPKHTYLLKLLKQTYLNLKDWNKLSELLPDLRKHKIGSSEELDALEQQVHIEKLNAAINSSADKSEQGKRASLQLAWNGIPKRMLSYAPVVADYINHLIALHDEDSAEKVLRGVLKKHWDDSLVELYGVIAGADIEKQLLLAEGWLKDRPNNIQLLTALGRLALRNQQWSKAKEYFDASIQITPTAPAYGELARLLASQGEAEASNENFKLGLALMSDGLPDLPLPQENMAAAS